MLNKCFFAEFRVEVITFLCGTSERMFSCSRKEDKGNVTNHSPKFIMFFGPQQFIE